MNFCNEDCELCHGRDYIDHGALGVELCPNRKKHIWSETLGIDKDEILSLNWEKSLPTKPFKQMKELFDKLLKRGYGWAYVYGPPGVGKSYTAKAAVVQARYKYMIDAQYTTHSKLLNHLRSSYDDDNGQRTYEYRLKALSYVPFLIIDEVGRDRGTTFGVSVLSDLLDARYEGAIRQKSVTILVSNFAPEAVLDDYQQDRVKDKRFDLMNVTGDSVRKVLTYKQSELMLDEADWWQKL